MRKSTELVWFSLNLSVLHEFEYDVTRNLQIFRYLRRRLSIYYHPLRLLGIEKFIILSYSHERGHYTTIDLSCIQVVENDIDFKSTTTEQDIQGKLNV